MIKVSKKDSIIDIILKIKKEKDKQIVLVFSFGHPILHNYTSLNILKNNAGEKDLIIVTNDLTTKKIGKRLGIKYSINENNDLLEYNYTFLEYSKYLIKYYFSELFNLFSKKGNDILYNHQKKYKNYSSKIGFFIIGLIVSIFLFIFIFYFAVNKTYIYITPEISIKNKAGNFIFKEVKEDEISNKNIIQLKKISKLVYITNTFGTSGIDKTNIKRSEGKVEIINKLNETVQLIKNTRLETENGIVFTIQNKVNIPKASYSSTGVLIPGKTKVSAISKIYDNKGKIIGKKGNILSGINLSLPGLKINKDKIYAKSISNFKGGSNNYTKQVTKTDIQNAKKNLELKIKAKALKELKNQIVEDNKINNIKYEILGIDNILEYDSFNIIGEDKVQIGDKIESFELSGTIKITSYTYNKDKIINKLTSSIRAHILENIETIQFINNNSLRISNILYKKTNPINIKATAQIEVFYVHNFLGKSNKYVQKLKGLIQGVKKEEALNILLNNSKISNAKIEIRPFFIKKISKISDNIIIKVIED